MYEQSLVADRSIETSLLHVTGGIGLLINTFGYSRVLFEAASHFLLAPHSSQCFALSTGDVTERDLGLFGGLAIHKSDPGLTGLTTHGTMPRERHTLVELLLLLWWC